MLSGIGIRIVIAGIALFAGQAIAIETCDLNNDGITGLGDLLLLQQALTAPPDPTPPLPPVSLTIGRGNEIFEPTTATVAQEWNIIATDLLGNALKNSLIQVSVRSLTFKEVSSRKTWS